MKKRTVRTSLWRFLFIVYCNVIVWLLFGREFGWDDGISYREMLRQNMNITPFYTINNYMRVIFGRTNDSVFMHCIINLAGNILLFIPIGVLAPKLWFKMRNFFAFFIIMLLSILIIEFTQLFTLLGCFDIDDIILNMTGLITGYCIWAITK